MMEAQKFIKEGGTVNGFLELKYNEQKAREEAQQNEGATTPPPKTSSSKKFEMEVLLDE